MTRLVIDNREVTVPAGSTILDAARKLGIDIPTLCHLDGLKPATSCMICLVKVRNWNRLVPSCATLADEGMEVESETDELYEIRRAGLELLLSDHVGDCTAPCQSTCPAHMDIPLMLGQVAAGELGEAIATVKSDIALPATLGRVCPELCERTCRRSQVDSPASICLIKRHVADVDLASETPYLPPCRPGTGKKIAIVGAGPTGLAAAFHLLQAGHACTVYDDNSRPGGVLRSRFDEEQLPPKVLDAEIAVIERIGAQFRMDVRIGKDTPLADLTDRFDAVLVAVGKIHAGDAGALGLQASKDGIHIDRTTHETNVTRVFAAGDAVHPTDLVIRNVADGKAAACNIDQHLQVGSALRTNTEAGPAVRPTTRKFASRVGRLSAEELIQLTLGASDVSRIQPAGGSTVGLTHDEAQAEALRCLHCDCGNLSGCRLRKYAQQYGAVATRYRGERRAFERHIQHGDIVYEPGKCILCGLCVQIATAQGEDLGLTFIGRGFDVRVGVPFNGTIAEGLTRAGKRCAEACPTGALAIRGALRCNAAGCGSCDAG